MRTAMGRPGHPHRGPRPAGLPSRDPRPDRRPLPGTLPDLPGGIPRTLAPDPQRGHDRRVDVASRAWTRSLIATTSSSSIPPRSFLDPGSGPCPVARTPGNDRFLKDQDPGEGARPALLDTRASCTRLRATWRSVHRTSKSSDARSPVHSTANAQVAVHTTSRIDKDHEERRSGVYPNLTPDLASDRRSRVSAVDVRVPLRTMLGFKR